MNNNYGSGDLVIYKSPNTLDTYVRKIKPVRATSVHTAALKRTGQTVPSNP